MSFAKLRGDLKACSKVMSMGGGPDVEVAKARSHVAKRAKEMTVPTLIFSEEDKEGTCQLYDDTLVVTIRIEGYDVKKVLVDQGSGAEIMYLNLFYRLNLRSEDLER